MLVVEDSNTLKFTPDGGRVIFAARPEGPDRFRVEVTGKRIVEAQGGQVGVQSEAGQGSTSFAVLPRDCSAVRDRPAGGSS